MLSEQARSAFVTLARATHKTDFNALVEVLRKRKIGKILHFTHVDNLESILSIGIQTKSEVIDSKIKFIETDPQRFDGFLESISFSIHMPNTFLLAVKNKELKNEIVVLEIAANCLLVKPFAAFPSNAAGGIFSDEITQDPYRFVGQRGLEGIYLNKNLRKEANLHSAEPTDQQSEILFFDTIDTAQILAIHLPKNFPEEKIKAINSLVKSGVNARVHENCNCGLFSRWSGVYRKYEIGWETNGK